MVLCFCVSRSQCDVVACLFVGTCNCFFFYGVIKSQIVFHKLLFCTSFVVVHLGVAEYGSCCWIFQWGVVNPLLLSADNAFDIIGAKFCGPINTLVIHKVWHL